jgi:hypothetical protein
MKTPKSLKWAGVALGATALTLGAAQLAQPDTKPTSGTSQASHLPVAASGRLDSVLVRSCGDCHSNTMSSHWSARVPPVSWILARGARKGRQTLNFADWASYSPDKQRGYLAASCTDAKTGRMPMAAYLRFRPDARLSARDVETICGAVR